MGFRDGKYVHKVADLKPGKYWAIFYQESHQDPQYDDKDPVTSSPHLGLKVFEDEVSWKKELQENAEANQRSPYGKREFFPAVIEIPKFEVKVQVDFKIS